MEFGRLVEQLGFESIWTSEHIVLPERYESRYPYSPTGKLKNDPTLERPAALIWLSFVAAATSTLRLGTGITMLPVRNPVLLAKEVATLDRMSSGRVELGVGLGWMREEYDALGARWEDRAARMEECIHVLRALWARPGPASFDGNTVKLTSVYCSPQPVQAQGVPILVAGHSDAAAVRAGRIGDGFFPMGVSSQRLADLIGLMRDAAKEAGRHPSALTVTINGPWDPDAVRAAEQLGVDRFVLFSQDPEIVDRPDRLVEMAAAVGLTR